MKSKLAISAFLHMKWAGFFNGLLGCSLIVTSSIVYAVPSSINAPVSGSGWRYSQHNPGGYYEGIGGANDGYSWDINYGTGWDDEGLSVYAVESGCIYTGNYWGGSSFGQLLIDHTTGSDQWSTGYLHMKNIVKKSGCVSKGEKIGEVSRTGYLVNRAIDFPHLHFAVYNSNGKYGLASVNANISEVTYPLTSENTKSYFDGAGSLVSPRESCWGCDKDEAKMHAHADKPSTVVFQWKYDGTRCEHVDVSTNPNVGIVAVRARDWSAHEMSAAFASPSPVSIPKQGEWTIFSVTSEKPLTSTVSVRAYCKTSADAKVGDPKDFINNPIVGFDSDYFWSGNGSIISRSSASTGYGVTRDLAVTYSGHKSLTVFQWDRSSSCPKIQLKDSNGTALSFQAGGVSMKAWDAPDFGANICSQLPCTVSAASNNYYLIKVKSAANEIPSGTLSAVCTN